ncbi:MAG TPA: arginine repressor [Clostridia bacterium]|nr:arginine repressor [Clostridia bacterium]
MGKIRRQKTIMEILKSRLIETQRELTAALKEKSIEVTQATISRDIKDLGIIKVPVEGKRFRYSLPGETASVNNAERLRRLFSSSVLSIQDSENLIIVRTLPGEAQGVASAVDNINWGEIIGTVAGDDTILIVVKPRKAVTPLLERFDVLRR